jgi:ribosome maturation factor RimP
MKVADLRGVIEERVARRGAQVVDLVVRREGEARVFEVFIDAEEAVTSEFCSDVSRDLRRVLDGAQNSNGSYRLTVSSPGMSRPLKFPWQFKKHIGRHLHIKAPSGDGHQDMVGELLSFDEGGIEVAVKEGKQRLRVAFDAILEARVKAPW